jgi:hypothetical protein
MTNFKVIREHQGDRFYKEGEIREGNLSDLEHLVPHVLAPVNETHAKAEPTPKNKAEPAAPANKAINRRKAKQKAN